MSNHNIFTVHADLIEDGNTHLPAHQEIKAAIVEDLRRSAWKFHRFILNFPNLECARQSSLIDDDGLVADFRKFDLDIADPTEGVFTYTIENTGLYFRVPYDYAKNPREFIDNHFDKNYLDEGNSQHHKTVTEAYRKLAPRMESEYPNHHLRIHRITPQGSNLDDPENPIMYVAYAYVYDGEGGEGGRYAICNDPPNDIVVANSIAVDLRTGQLVSAETLLGNPRLIL